MGRGGARIGKEVKGAGEITDDGSGSSKGDDVTQVDSDAELAQATFDENARTTQMQLQRMREGIREHTALHRIHARRHDVRRRSRLRCEVRDRALVDGRIARVELERRTQMQTCFRSEILERQRQAELMARHATGSHAMSMRGMITTFVGPDRMCAVCQEGDQFLNRMQGDFEAERATIANEFQDAQREFADVGRECSVRTANEDEDAQQKLDMARESLRSSNLEQINDLKVTLDKTISDLEAKFDAAHFAYVQSTEERAGEFKTLQDNDAMLSADIDRKLKRNEALQAEIMLWRKKLATSSNDSERRNKALRAERDTLHEQLFRMKEGMAKDRDNAYRQLRQLTRTCRDARRDAKLRLDQATRIVKQAELASKMSATGAGVDGDDLLRNELFSLDEDDQGDKRSLLAAFQKKLSGAMLTRLYAKRERDALKKENEKLKEVLKGYLEAINVTPVALDQNNSLMMVNGRTNLVRPLPRKPGRVTAVDGNAIINNMVAMQGAS
ncbi:Dynein regulatory complex protein 1/2 N-terminal domain-containing protein [Plasmodiophora brassicae]